jgi:pimeloyl-ACP methyl ester carboxylesterase
MRWAYAGVLIAVVGCSPAVGSDKQSATAPDGVDIVYEVFGGDDPTIVLVHGWTNNRQFWHPHIETLSETHRVVALDLAGFGESGHSRTEWTMQNFGEDIAAVARKVRSDQLVLVGFSMGGAAVLEAAKIIPDRVIGVVLVDAFHDPEEQFGDSTGDALISQYRAILGDRDPGVLRQTVFSPATPDSLIQRLRDNLPDSIPEFWWNDLEELFHWNDEELTRTLEAIDAPIEAINSDQTPTNIEAFREYVPSFEVGIMPGVGHLGVIWENLELFDDLLLQAVERFQGS